MKVVHLARKPLAEPSVAANVEVYGTGGINVDATRAPYEASASPASNPLYRATNGYSITTGSDTNGVTFTIKATKRAMNVHRGGRWPANLILGHAPKCVRVSSEGEPDRWSCVAGCPATDLDRSADDRVSRYFKQVGT